MFIKPQPNSPSTRGFDAYVCIMASWRHMAGLVKRHGGGWGAEFA